MLGSIRGEFPDAKIEFSVRTLVPHRRQISSEIANQLAAATIRQHHTTQATDIAIKHAMSPVLGC
jgi:hypothetical protein